MSPCRVLLPGDRPIGTRQLTILDQSQSSITCRALLGSAGREVSCDSAVQQFRIYLAKAENLRVERGRNIAFIGSRIATDQERNERFINECVPTINPGISNFRACALEQHSDQFKQNRVMFFPFPKISKS